MLNFTVEEWDNLPWWQARLYLDGMMAETESESGESARGDGSAPGAAVRWKDVGDLSAAGFKVERGQASGPVDPA